MTRNNAGVRIDGYRGKSDTLLGDAVFRLILHSLDQGVVTRRFHSSGKFRMMTEPWKEGFDHEFFEMRQNVPPGIILAAPPGRN